MRPSSVAGVASSRRTTRSTGIVLEAIPNAEPLARRLVRIEAHELAHAELAVLLELDLPRLDLLIARAHDLDADLGRAALQVFQESKSTSGVPRRTNTSGARHRFGLEAFQ